MTRWQVDDQPPDLAFPHGGQLGGCRWRRVAVERGSAARVDSVPRKRRRLKRRFANALSPVLPAPSLSVPNRKAFCGFQSSVAKSCRAVEHGIKDRREVPGRRVDDLQYLSRSGLLFESLLRLGQEPCVLHCDDRLRREILQKAVVTSRVAPVTRS
jgi:hypothetical protein